MSHLPSMPPNPQQAPYICMHSCLYDLQKHEVVHCFACRTAGAPTLVLWWAVWRIA